MPFHSAAVAIAACILSGPTNPPPGPVTSTYKTLQEVEPRIAISQATTPGDADSVFRIAQSGSYYLIAEVEATGARAGIEIDWAVASNVSIDLNGFRISGSASTAPGIRTMVFAGGTTLILRNGTIAGMGSWGVDAYAQTLTIESVSVLDCVNGIKAAGNVVSVTRCKAFRNGTGFRLEGMARVAECIAEMNTGDGYFTFGTCSFDRCSSLFSGGDGFEIGSGCTITACEVAVATAQGIRAGSSCTIRGNTVQNTGAGAADGAGILVTGTGNRIDENHVLGCDRGIDVDGLSNTIIRNTAHGNTVNYDIVSPGSQWLGGIVSTPGGMGTATPWANFASP
mgnify:CR=1 FL=1